MVMRQKQLRVGLTSPQDAVVSDVAAAKEQQLPMKWREEAPRRVQAAATYLVEEQVRHARNGVRATLQRHGVVQAVSREEKGAETRGTKLKGPPAHLGR
jgi:hypothetical protein